MKLVGKIIVHCIIPLLVGTIIYALLHPLYTFYYFNKLPLVATQSALKNIVLFYFPDLFWDYSFAAALYLYAIHYSISYKKIQLVICFLLLAAEAIQLFMPRYFTFDILDILVALIAIALASLIIIPAHEKYKKVLST